MSMRSLIRLTPAALLGVGAALLVSCGSSGKGLIPLKYAGPLEGDFQVVLQAAQEGDGSCTVTEAKVRKTEHDLRELPASVDGGLRGRLAEGVANLSIRAHELCAQPLAQTTTTSTTRTSAPPAITTQTNPTTPATTPTTGTTTTPTTSQPEEPEGGTQAPGLGNGNGNGNGNGRGNGEGQPGEGEFGGQEAGADQRENGAGAAVGGTGGTGGGQ